MKNLKIRVNSEAEAEEVKRLAVKAGYKLDALFGKKWSAEFCYLLLCEDMSAGFANEIMADGDKLLSIGELWAMTNPMREYLDSNRNYKFLISTEKDDGFIEIPEGAIRARFYPQDPDGLEFENAFCQWWHGENQDWLYYADYAGSAQHSRVVWQRDQDEPFLTPECTLNDQYAEIEQVRQVEIHGTVEAKPDFNFGAAQSIKDNVNHPSHYTQGKVECIDALESATIGKSGIEAVCVANVIKYLWRYEEKNGLEDVKKAQFYLNRLLATLEINNG